MEALKYILGSILFAVCIIAVVMMIIAVILHRMGIIDFDILEWFKLKQEKKD